MAEIDTNPLTPVWPQFPVRKIDPEEKSNQDRPRKKIRQDDDIKKGDGDDDSSPHIDEYA